MLPVLLLTVVIDLIGFGLILPLLPFYATSFGASPVTIAFLAAVFSIAQFLSATPLGGLSDRLGRRPIFLCCMALTVIGYVWLASADSLLGIFLARTVAGIGSGKISIARAIIADSTPPEQRARGMGLIGGAFGIGMILGPLIGGLLIGPDPLHPNYALPAMAAAATSGIALVLAFFTVRETRPGATQPLAGLRLWRNPLAPLSQLNRVVLALIAINFSINFVFSQVEVLFPLFSAARLDWHAYEVGIAFTFIGTIVLSMQGFLIGPLTRLFGERKLLTMGMINLAAGTAMAHWIVSTPMMGLSIILTASGVAMIGPTINSLASRSAEASQQGIALGTMESLAALGRTFGPLWGGWLFDRIGMNVPYWIGGALLIVTLALGWRSIHPRDTP
jgi:DHA1 family tetracycline resistance protein-like MFS transporter